MTAYLRFAPALVVVVLVIGRLFNPAFLSGEAFWHITWFWLILIPALWVSAWLLSPVLAAWMVMMSRRAIVPAFVFIALAMGLLWVADMAWNETIASWTDAPKSGMVQAITNALFGGNP